MSRPVVADLNLGGLARVRGLPAPLLPDDAATKSFAEQAMASWPYFEGTASNTGTAVSNFVFLPVQASSVVDSHGGNLGDGYYTIPASGVYDCFYNGRMQDGINQSRGFQIGIASVATDALTSEWRATYPVLRNAFQHRRVAFFAAGTKIAPIMYTDGFSANVGGAFTVIRIR